jgi:hypothetical protein
MRCTLMILGSLLTSAAISQAQDGLPQFNHKDGHSSVVFPGKPRETTQTVKTDAGDLNVTTTTYATPDGSGYLVSYTELPAALTKPENRDDLFRGVRTGLMGKNGKLVTEKKATVGGVEGREILIDKGKQQTRFRVAVMGTRLYQVATLGTGEFVTGPDSTAFLDSFEFTK